MPGFIEAGVQSWSSCQRINNHKAIVHEYGDKIILNPGIMFPEYDGMELTEEEKRQQLLQQEYEWKHGPQQKQETEEIDHTEIMYE